MSNIITIENQKPGTPKSVWDAPSSNQIEGFATDFSVDNGSTVSFKVNVNVNAGQTAPFRMEIYRLGYYGGDGATLVTTLNNLTGVRQPNPFTDDRGLVDAGNWSVSASWTTPADAVSGVYLAKLIRTDNGATNQIPFIVRDDDRASDIVLQTSDTTWQAYNGWAGRNGQVGGSLYGGFDQPANIAPDQSPLDPDRAFAVSYNRPIISRDGGGTYAGAQDYLFGADYAAINFLEKNGYDVTYISGVDTDRLGIGALTDHKAYISVGHDEYWSGDQRANVEAARDAGVNLLFWSGNEVYWKTRWENSIVDGTSYRTLVTYKETKFNYTQTATAADYPNVDPSNQWTGTWRDTRFVDAVAADGVTHTAVGARPENSLTGQLFGPDGTGQFGGAIDIPAAFAGLRVWRDTGVGPGGVQDLAPGILGYEWDTSPDDAFRPPTLIKLSDTTIPWGEILVDQGNRTEAGIATHNLSLYRAPSGALVFGAGTVFWSWGLSNEHDSSPYGATIASKTLQQFAVNMFADMGIQPGVTDAILASQNLVRATASNDHIAATTTLNDIPATVTALSTVTISGVAQDIDNNPTNADGRVAIVEVSLDGGQTWRLAQGTTNWSFNWTPTLQGSYTIKARAIDDSLNVLPNAQLATDVVTVTGPQTPSTVSLFGATVTPTGTLSNDGAGVELGVKFSATVAGSVTALRYFRATGDSDDTDVRTGHLWAADGTLLGTVNFTSGPGQSGWQVAQLTTPVALQPGVNYVVSYHTADNYLGANNYFTSGVTEPFGMLTAASSTQAFGNGVYAYGATPVFPTESYQASNYWADVVFAPAGQANAAPTFTTGNSFSTPENTTLVTVVSATDPDGNALTYAVAGGGDGALFSINAATGELRFKAAPDFEAPRDIGADNNYAVTVSASDGIAPPVLQTITVTVTDVAEAPSGAASFAGRLIRAEYIFGSTANTLFPTASATQTATVDTTAGAVEFANLPNADPSAIGNGQFGLASVDLTAQTITINFPLDPAVFNQAFVPFLSVQQTAFNGVRLTDADGQLPMIRGISIVSQHGFTDGNGNAASLTTGDFTITSEGVFLNMAGKGRMVDADPATAGAQPAQVVIAVDLNDSPVASADTVATNKNVAIEIPAATLLAHDTDADGDALSISSVDTAVNGTATFDPVTRVVTFTPTADFTGQASFRYTVVDGFGGSGSAIVTVNVAATSGHAPTVTPINAGTTNEDAVPLNINLLAGAADPDGDPLSVQNVTLASSNAARTVQFSLAPGGVLTLNPAQFNNMAQGATETITATYQVSDGVNVTSNTATLTMEGRNDAPVAANDAYATGEATVLTGNVITNPAGTDVDPDGTTLTVVAINGSAAAVGAPITLASGARLTVNPSGAFTYDPNGAFDALNTGQQGADSFTYTVSDGALSSSATTAITINGATNAGLVLTGNNSANTLNGAAGNDSISGLGGGDVLSGNGGADTIDGGTGTDTVNGGAGDDVLLIRGTEAQTDRLTGGDGLDTLRVIAAGGTVTLSNTSLISGVETFDGAGQSVQGTSSANLLDFSIFQTVTGVTSILGQGSGDTLIGSAGGDILNGGGGADSLDGRLGDDVIIIRGSEAQSDTIAGGGGTDTVRVDAAGGIVTLSGTGAISGVENFDGSGQGIQGNSSGNVLDFSIFTSVTGVASIAGLGGSDTIVGTSAADLIDGGAAGDQLSGGGGADTLIGGSGADTLSGGAGDDVFRFVAFSDSPSSARDVILDFQGAGVAGGDVIDVSALVAGAFVFRGTAAFSGGGVPSIRYVISGGVTDLQFDNGNGGSAEMVVRINAATTFVAGDFIL